MQRHISYGLKKTIQFFLLAFLLFTIVPIFQSVPYASYISLGAYTIMLWFLVLFNPKSFCTKVSGESVLRIAVTGYMLVFPLVFGNLTITNRYFALSNLLIFPLVCDSFRKNKMMPELWQVQKIVITLMLVSSVITSINLVNNPYLSRSIKSEGDESIAILSQGIGGYSLVYFLVFLMLLIIGDTRKPDQNPIQRTFKYCVVVLSGVTIFLSNYMTAFLMMLMGIVCLYLLNQRSTKKGIKFFVISSLIILLIIFGNYLIEFVLNTLLLVIPSGKNADRLYVMIQSLKESSQLSIISEFMSDRYPRIIISIEGFLEHPILGQVVEKMTLAGTRLEGYGHHSHIFDTLALYGAPVSAIYIYLLFHPFIKMRRMSVNAKHLVTSVMLIYILFCTINNMVTSVSMLVYCTLFTIVAEQQESTQISTRSVFMKSSIGRRKPL